MAVVHPFERPLRIRFAHCDPAGIVFFPQYLVMINNLVEDWVTDALGVPYAELLGRRRTGMPTVSLQCEFTAISRMGDDVMLGLTVERLGGKSITLQIGCRCGDEQRMVVRQVLVFTHA
jgi:4-hydroxybenzoyl-CoA thioesterase